MRERLTFPNAQSTRGPFHQASSPRRRGALPSAYRLAEGSSYRRHALKYEPSSASSSSSLVWPSPSSKPTHPEISAARSSGMPNVRVKYADTINRPSPGLSIWVRWRIRRIRSVTVAPSRELARRSSSMLGSNCTGSPLEYHSDCTVGAGLPRKSLDNVGICETIFGCSLSRPRVGYCFFQSHSVRH